MGADDALLARRDRLELAGTTVYTADLDQTGFAAKFLELMLVSELVFASAEPCGKFGAPSWSRRSDRRWCGHDRGHSLECLGYGCKGFA